MPASAKTSSSNAMGLACSGCLGFLMSSAAVAALGVSAIGVWWIKYYKCKEAEMTFIQYSGPEPNNFVEC